MYRMYEEVGFYSMSLSAGDLAAIAQKLRAEAVKMVYRSRASHLGSCLSMADILACLYWQVLKINPAYPDWNERDRFILSKGHGAAILYASLAFRGFFPIEELEDYCKAGSVLTGHVTSGVPGVEFSSGSLGHGLPVACGIALAARRTGMTSRVVVLSSDGEWDEGSNWEAALFAPHHQLDNLLLIINYNKIQSFGFVKDVIDIEPLAAKFKSFRWGVREIDGHNMEELLAALSDFPFVSGHPSVVIANTVKGKGVSWMENLLEWHYRSPTDEQLALALRELGQEA